MSTFKIRAISEIALLAAFIAVSGAFKLPSFIPGSEFQLSAPLAVAICGVFGTKKYLLAGLLASAGGLKAKSSTCYLDRWPLPQHALRSVLLSAKQFIPCWRRPCPE